MAIRAGADLKAARERLGLSLDDVAVDLRIRLPHLQALEEGRVSLLPGTAYAVAYVRIYANRLGLDATEMVRRFKTEATGFSRRNELVFPVPMAERRLPAGAVALLGVVLSIGVYAGWYRLSGEGRIQAETTTAIPERLASLAEQALPPRSSSPSAQPSAIAADALADASPAVVVPDPAEPDAVAAPAAPAMTISPTSAAAAQFPPNPADPVAAIGGSLGPAVTAVEPNRLVLRATADSWLLVKDRAGAVLLNRVLKSGETWTVPARNDLLLTTGNAGGTAVVLDGAPLAGLGGDGVVRRELMLDPDQIKDGKLVGSGTAPLASARPRQ